MHLHTSLLLLLCLGEPTAPHVFCCGVTFTVDKATAALSFCWAKGRKQSGAKELGRAQGAVRWSRMMMIALPVVKVWRVGCF